jgi:Tfp pilus assembly PilM family ATPase
MSISHILNILNPQPAIGGLEINNSALKFVLIKENKLTSTSLNLTAGVIEEGKIKNGENFKAALLKLHSQITPGVKKKIYVILNIPDINIYAQVFNLPVVAVDNLEEAAHLNLQMISPTDFSSVYSDWQKVGETNIDGGQIEILSAFVPNKIVDEFVQCLKETNFVVAAIEFSGLAISRLISGLKEPINSFLLLHLTSSGLNFSLIRNRNLYFNHFVLWPAGEERQISLAAIKEIIIREAQKVLNFASSHWPETQINTLLLAAPALEEKISQIITENFSLSVQKVTLSSKLTAPDGRWSIINNQLTSLTSDWFSALGSSLRGLIPRSQDIIISLAGTGTEEEFRQHQIINFIKIWRNIALTSISFIFIAFMVVEGFLMKTTNSLNNQLANLANLPELGEVNKLQEEAEEFNEQVELGLQVKNQIYSWSPLFEKIKSLAGNDIIIERIFIQSQETPILFNGRAADEKAIIDFKTKLEQDFQFKDINLPLAGIASAADGSLRFTITFKLK